MHLMRLGILANIFLLILVIYTNIYIFSEKLVQQSIDELQQSKSQTTIVIAHRLTTIKVSLLMLNITFIYNTITAK